MKDESRDALALFLAVITTSFGGSCVTFVTLATSSPEATVDVVSEATWEPVILESVAVSMVLVLAVAAVAAMVEIMFKVQDDLSS